MIRYNLSCTNDHQFEAWFAGSQAYDRQAGAGQVTCPVCGTADVGKTLMTPSVSTARKKTDLLPAPDLEQAPDRGQPAGGSQVPAVSVAANPEMPEEVRTMLRTVRDHVIQNADNVGEQFAEEARKIHYGEREKRGIYGQASLDEVKNLQEEGIGVMPLPVLPEDRN